MEEIVLVNIDDEIVGSGEKLEVHRRGLLHRAFSIFVINDKGQMLIQKRNENKYHSGGLWTNSCCSHQRVNEELEEAIHRRLQEEMGFDCELQECFDFVYRTVFEDMLVEYELDHVYVGKYNGEVFLNENEASEFMWISLDDLKNKLLTEPHNFTVWFLTAAPRVIKGMECI